MKKQRTRSKGGAKDLRCGTGKHERGEGGRTEVRSVEAMFEHEGKKQGDKGTKRRRRRRKRDILRRRQTNTRRMDKHVQ